MKSQDVRQLIEQTTGQVQVAAALMAYAGLWLHEVAELRHGQIVYIGDVLLIEVGPGKDARRSFAVAHGRLCKILSEHRGEPADLVVGWPIARVLYELRRAMQSSGIKGSVYDLRDYYARLRYRDPY